MKTISNLIVMAFLCLILTPAFAGVPTNENNSKPVTWKKTRIKVKLPHATDYCYMTVYYHDNGPTIQNGQYGDLVDTYIKIEDYYGNPVYAATNITFTLDVYIGPAGSSTITPLTYYITEYDDASYAIDNVFVQRTISEADYAGFSSSPTTTGAYTISLNGGSPYSY